MRRLTFLLVFSIIVIMTGCKKDEVAGPGSAPGNLSLTLIQKGLGLRVDWDAVADATGYYLKFGADQNSLLSFVKVIATTYYILDSLALDDQGTGYYAVLAVGGEYGADTSAWSALVRSAPIKTENVRLYERDYANGDSSAFGWDESGNGTVYSINDATNRWHIYLDDGISGLFDILGFKFVTPGDSVGSNSPPPVPWNSTFITGHSTAKAAPLVINEGFAPDPGGIAKDNVFYLFIDSTYYAMIVVTEVLENGVKFDAYFQDFEGFRRF